MHIPTLFALLTPLLLSPLTFASPIYLPHMGTLDNSIAFPSPHSDFLGSTLLTDALLRVYFSLITKPDHFPTPAPSHHLRTKPRITIAEPTRMSAAHKHHLSAHNSHFAKVHGGMLLAEGDPCQDMRAGRERYEGEELRFEKRSVGGVVEKRKLCKDVKWYQWLWTFGCGR